MTKRLLLACALATVFLPAACGGDPVASPTPTPVHSVPSGVITPVDESRSTVDQLNQLQNRTEQQTGGSGYTP